MTEQQKRTRKPTAPLNEFGKFFTSFRVYEEITLTEWADMLNLTTMTINRIERGKNLLTLEQIRMFNHVLKDYPTYQKEFIKLVADTQGVLIISEVSSSVKTDVITRVLNPSLYITLGGSASQGFNECKPNID